MRSVLSGLSDSTWENLGIVFGGMGCATIGHQVLHEWRTPPPSSVSLWFIVGFLVIYVFWFLYGIRFGRRGIWLPNALATVLQVLFAIVVLAKA